MKFNNKEYELPALDSVMHVALASAFVAYALVTAFPVVQAWIA